MGLQQEIPVEYGGEKLIEGDNNGREYLCFGGTSLQGGDVGLQGDTSARY